MIPIAIGKEQLNIADLKQLVERRRHWRTKFLYNLRILVTLGRNTLVHKWAKSAVGAPFLLVSMNLREDTVYEECVGL